MSKSIGDGSSHQARTKPKKPYPDCPIFPHATRRWCKKHRGRFVYFGPWEDFEGAMQNYRDWCEGKTPRKRGELTVSDAVNHFLNAKASLRDNGELAARTWAEYKATGERIAAAFTRDRPVSDLRGEDFTKLRATLAAQYGPVRLGNEVQRTRTIFKYAFESELIDKPVRLGPDFKRPSKKTMRVHRAERGERMFEAKELRKILQAASPAIKAMCLLGVNCAYGNADMAGLEFRHIDMKTGWANYARKKTGIARRCPLWPETIAAVKQWLAVRPEPKDPAYAARVFITKFGVPWDMGSVKGYISNPIGQEFKKLVDKLGLHREGLGLYTLRHVHRTIADATKDGAAIDYIMGHARDDMGSHYLERIDNGRLQAVADTVRAWLFPPKKKAKPRRG